MDIVKKKGEKSFSEYNILGKIKDSPDYFLINILNGSADIIDEKTAQQIKKGLMPQQEELEKKGYIVNKEDEKIFFINSYCELSELMQKAPLSILFVPWLECNLTCSFCPFTGNKHKNKPVSDSVIHDFFSYLDTYLGNRKKSIIIAGGEPLLQDKHHTTTLNKIIRQTYSKNIPIHIKTNGYFLFQFLQNTAETTVESIHIKVDIHNTPFAHKDPSDQVKDYMDALTKGITLNLEKGIQTRLTCMVDNKSIEALHLFAEYATNKGWTAFPSFTTDIISKDNYTLCDPMLSLAPFPAPMIDILYNTLLKFPEILELSCPPFSVTKTLFTHTVLPPPLFQACPGARNELLFLYDGTIYPCISAMASSRGDLGTFSPKVTIQSQNQETWEERDITAIEACRKCPVQLICGSGCTARALETTGEAMSRDCIPVKEYIEAGLSLYFDKQLLVK